MRCTISVQLDEGGPALLRYRERDRHGRLTELERGAEPVLAAEDAAWRELLASGRRLPGGTVEVEVGCDQWGRFPDPLLVGRVIAQAA
jgi:hypothetical protein